MFCVSSVSDTLNLMSAVSKDKDTELMVEELKLLETLATEYEDRAREEKGRHEAVLTEMYDFETKLKGTEDRMMEVDKDVSFDVQGHGCLRHISKLCDFD